MTAEKKISKKPEELYSSYLSIGEALKYKDTFIQMFESGRLLQIAQKILNSYKQKSRTKNLADLDAERIVQDLAVEFLRPVKGQGMEEESELHRLRLYNPNKGTKFETYIYQCMHNLVITLIDKCNRTPDPISYDNLIGKDEEENAFLNIIACETREVPLEKIQEIITEFQGTIQNKLDQFVFEKLVHGLGKTHDGKPKEFKPKEFTQKAEEAGVIKNWKRMYAKILRSRRQLLEQFKEFLSKHDCFS